MSGPFSFPVVFGSTGVQPQAPSSILAQLLAAVAATNPGYTANLPGSLIEDVSSTDTGAVVLIDSYRVELLNSLTPYGCNEFILAQLGQQTGIQQGTPVNTSVNVVFTGTVGFVINAGFQVSDGTHVYQLVDAGIIGGGGTSASLTAVAVASGSWAVPANTVTALVTSVAGAITLSVTNPAPGTPGGSAETAQSYRARVLQAGRASAQGMPSFLKTLIQNVPGVVPRLVRVIGTLGVGLEVIVGGGDNYAVALAILKGVFDPSALIQSSLHPGNNVLVTVNDYPDLYTIPFVNPPSAVVTLTLTWNTTQADFTQGNAVNTTAVQPLADYVNSIPVGSPINLLELNDTFVNAVAGILDENTISKMNWVVTINAGTAPLVGTLYAAPDAETYFTIVNTAIALAQG